jgi:hypothetical protein
MANELRHKDPGAELTQAEYITSDGTGHVFESQATGDILYASSSTVLSRLAKGSDGNVLELASGLPAWTASPTIGSTSWANANHAHAASNSGGTLTTLGTITTGVWNGTALVKAYIGADAIDGSKIEDNAIDSEHYTDGSIDNAHLADDAVDSDEIAAGAIDTAHIADNQVTAAKLADIARGSIIYGNASAATAELTKGGANTVLTSDGTDISWAAASSGAVVREGGQTSEGTTTSTSSATVITAASLTAQAAEPVQIFYDVRKTTGGAYSMASGLTLNSTSVRSVVALTNASNRAEDAGHIWMIPPRVTNYLGNGIGAFGGYLTLTPAVRAYDAASPNAEITDVLVLGSVQNAAITAGADELHVYSMANS